MIVSTTLVSPSNDIDKSRFYVSTRRSCKSREGRSRRYCLLQRLASDAVDRASEKKKSALMIMKLEPGVEHVYSTERISSEYAERR